MRMTEDAYNALMGNKTSSKKHKYNAQRVLVDNMWFASKLEAEMYGELKILQRAGEVSWFTRQIPFWFPDGGKYVADFISGWKDGLITVIESKGFETEDFKRKKKLFERHYPLDLMINRFRP